MSSKCEGCGIEVSDEQRADHYLLCKDTPFLAFGNAELLRQSKAYSDSCDEFQNKSKTIDSHMYKNMEIGGVADIPCTGCPSFRDHLNGHCIADKNVKSFEGEARYLLNKILFELKKTMDLAMRLYNEKADSMHAEALELSPDLTPELITKLSDGIEARQRLRKREDRPEETKYRRSMELIQTAKRIKEVAVERSERILQRQQEGCERCFESGKNLVAKTNRLHIVENVVNGKLNRTFLKKVGL